MYSNRIRGATQLYGTRVTFADPDYSGTVPIPAGAIACTLYSARRNFWVAIHPSIVGVALFNGELSPNTNPWLTRGSLRSLTLDMTDSREDHTSGNVLMGANMSSYLYVGFAAPVSGMAVDVDSANTSTSALSGEYWNGEDWIRLRSFRDLTKIDTVTLAQDGTISWDGPGVLDWQANVINPMFSKIDLPSAPVAYWMRLSWSVSLSSNTVIKGLYSAMPNMLSIGAFFPAGELHKIDLEKFCVGGLSVRTRSEVETLYINFMVNEIPWVYPANGLFEY